jgi:hypothetical protein
MNAGWYIDELDNTVTQDHDANAQLYYGVDVARRLTTGDSLVSAKVYLAATGAELTPVVIQGTKVGYKVLPATPTLAPGTKLGLTFEWVTAFGDKDQRTVWLNVLQA